jgi:hypothetical protein
MHVHFDKDIYLPGETIWFKAYLYRVNETSYSSTNFYVALYDENGKLLQQKQYPIFEGSCHGDFDIPDSMQGGRLQFRAFTKAMIMEDSSNVYQRILQVYNKGNSSGDISVSKTKSLQFFPEGGQLIAELENHIGFKAVYPDGSPAMINGQIVDAISNKVIDTFFTNQMGLGKFILIPAPRKIYTAVWKDENGMENQTPLPAINRYGVSYHAEIINSELRYTIAKNKSSDSLNMLHMLAQMGKYQVYKAGLVIPNEMEMYTAKFSISGVPAGLMQLTLFDKNWNPLQERLVFINDNAIYQQPVINRTEVNAGAKGKNTIEIVLPDTMFTNLSASIADLNFYNLPNTYSINQELLFNTQLMELNQDVNSVLVSANNLDLIVLSHKWKKYNWQKATDRNTIKPEVLDNYISLAIDYKEKNRVLPTNAALNLVIKNKNMGNQFYNLKPASPTSFRKTDLIFFDSVRISYQMDKNKELVNSLTLSKESALPIPQYITALPGKISLAALKPESQFGSIEPFVTDRQNKFNELQTLKEVIVKTRYRNPQQARIEELDKFYTSGTFSGTRGFQLNVIDDSSGIAANNNLQNYILYRVPGLSIMDADMGVRRTIVGTNRKGDKVIKDTIFQCATFIDEVQVESNELQLLNMWNVAYVKYIPGIVIGAGFKAIDGAIYVYTKKGTEKGPPSKGLPFVYIKGYNLQKEFISPDYSDKDLLKAPDRRTTLYWNPNIIMDKTNNNIKLEYYNNDISKKLLLTIEGVNVEGKLIHVEKVIE